VVVGRLLPAELPEDLAHVRLNRFRAEEKRVQMALFERPSAISPSTSRSVSSSSGPSSRGRFRSRETIVGSMTHSPSSIRLRASASTAAAPCPTCAGSRRRLRPRRGGEDEREDVAPRDGLDDRVDRGRRDGHLGKPPPQAARRI
jgi:hypothetical protein